MLAFENFLQSSARELNGVLKLTCPEPIVLRISKSPLLERLYADPDLVRVLGPITELPRSWRMLTTRQLRRTPRVAAFFAFVASEAQAMRKILTG